VAPELLVNIDVPDLDRAEAFYCAAFALRVHRRFGRDGAELRGTSATLFLLVKPEGSQPVPGRPQQRDYQRHWSPVHLDFVVPDIDAAVARALAAGAVLEKPVSTARWGRLAVMADPFGHGFCFVQFLNRGYDEIAEPLGAAACCGTDATP
jgi:catechol 2,3-dioxygenase-like lactoylglutathione lyase family enzyme